MVVHTVADGMVSGVVCVLLYLELIGYGVVVHTVADGMVSGVVCVLLYL